MTDARPRAHPLRSTSVLLIILTHLLVPAYARAASDSAPEAFFTIASRAGTEGVVTAPWAKLPEGPIPESPMLRELAGIAATLTASDIRDLNRAVARVTRITPDQPEGDAEWAIHLLPPSNAPRMPPRSFCIVRTPEGWPLAIDPATNDRVRLETALFDRSADDWIRPRPDPSRPAFVPSAGQASDSAEAPEETASRPFTIRAVASPIRLDHNALSVRFARGNPPPFSDPLVRTIDDESFTAVLPIDESAEGASLAGRPLPLLVWINPTPDAAPPPAVVAACRQLGFLVVTPANAGNDRPVVDRLQLALDAAESARRAFWVDRERTYIGGLSGGGRLASMLWAGAPDIFTGALCVVGINSHHRIPVGNGTSWPATHRIPLGDALRTLRLHPIAAISGEHDFNLTESNGRVGRLRRENFRARLFDLPGLGHQLPGAQDLATALAWVDHAALDRRAEHAEAAQALLERVPEESKAGPPSELSELERRSLERVTLIAPWTAPAWEAAAILGYADRPQPSATPDATVPTPSKEPVISPGAP